MFINFLIFKFIINLPILSLSIISYSIYTFKNIYSIIELEKIKLEKYFYSKKLNLHN